MEACSMKQAIDKLYFTYSFLNGYMYCCFLQGFKCETSGDLHIKDSTQFIDAVIKAVENYYP